MRANLRITFPNMSDDDFTIFCGVLEEKEKLEQENQQLKEENEMLKLTIEKLTKTPYVYGIRGGKNE